MFATRKVSRAHRRKRPAEQEEDDDQASSSVEADSPESLSLDDLKELQRERSRTKGVAADRHAAVEVEEAESQPEEKDEEEWGLLKRTFQDTGARLGTEHDVDKHMEEWVNKKLAAMGHKVAAEAADEETHRASEGSITGVQLFLWVHFAGLFDFT